MSGGQHSCPTLKAREEKLNCIPAINNPAAATTTGLKEKSALSCACVFVCVRYAGQSASSVRSVCLNSPAFMFVFKKQ